MRGWQLRFWRQWLDPAWQLDGESEAAPDPFSVVMMQQMAAERERALVRGRPAQPESVLYAIGDDVYQEAGDYTFAGVVVSCYANRRGVIRYVVEDDRGISFILPASSLKAGRPGTKQTNQRVPAQDRAVVPTTTTKTTEETPRALPEWFC